MEKLNGPNINKQISQQNILFYMESCKTCNVFINLAQKSNILKHFRMICIDGQKDKFKAQGLKKVPTIIIPSINKQLEGSDCLKWLEDMIKFNSNNNLIPQEELIVPNITLFTSNPTNTSNPINSTNTSNPINSTNTSNPINSTNNMSQYQNQSNKNPNIRIDEQITQLSSQLNQLATQINSDTKNNKNQFDVNKNNTIKRNSLLAIQPPPTNNFKQRQGYQLPNSNDQNQGLGQNQGSGPVVKPINQLFGYLQSEMSGFSDSYAYVNIDNPLPKSFLPPDKDMEIYTAPEGDKIDGRKQDEMIKLIEIERVDQHNKFSQAITELNNRIALGDNSVMPKWLGSNPNL